MSAGHLPEKAAHDSKPEGCSRLEDPAPCQHDLTKGPAALTSPAFCARGSRQLHQFIAAQPHLAIDRRTAHTHACAVQYMASTHSITPIEPGAQAAQSRDAFVVSIGSHFAALNDQFEVEHPRSPKARTGSLPELTFELWLIVGCHQLRRILHSLTTRISPWCPAVGCSK